MSTIGDPILDFARFLAVWPDGGPAIEADMPYFSDPLLPSRADLCERYAARSRLDLSDIEYYEILACYRLAVVLEGSYARACSGRADMAVGLRLHSIAVNLMGRAIRIITGEMS